MPDAALMKLVRTIAAGDDVVVSHLLAANPTLAKARFQRGATRGSAGTYYIEEITHYVYAGDTALHLAAAAHQERIAQRLIAVGADVGARNRRTLDKSGVSPLHRAVRTRCAAAVRALLEGGADPRRKNKSGSPPMLLATQNTGRGGTGSLEAKAQQACIVRLLKESTAKRG